MRRGKWSWSAIAATTIPTLVIIAAVIIIATADITHRGIMADITGALTTIITTGEKALPKRPDGSAS